MRACLSLRHLAFVSVLGTLATAAHAEDMAGCIEGPVLTPGTGSAGDLRCFPTVVTKRAWVPVGHGVETKTPIFPIALASVGAAGVATFIGFGIGGSSMLVGGAAPSSALESVRVDYAIANVALAVGVTALVTAVVLALVHH